MNSCNAAAASTMFGAAAVMNSCNAAASSKSRSRTTRADDREYYKDLFYSLLEEGRRTQRPALADDDADAGGRRREDKPAACCPLGPAWKIAIRSVIMVASMVAAAFLASLAPTCESWSDAFPLLASLVMLVMIAAIFWALTLDYFMDPEYQLKRRMRRWICQHVQDIN